MQPTTLTCLSHSHRQHGGVNACANAGVICVCVCVCACACVCVCVCVSVSDSRRFTRCCFSEALLAELLMFKGLL